MLCTMQHCTPTIPDFTINSPDTALGTADMALKSSRSECVVGLGMKGKSRHYRRGPSLQEDLLEEVTAQLTTDRCIRLNQVREG